MGGWTKLAQISAVGVLVVGGLALYWRRQGDQPPPPAAPRPIPVVAATVEPRDVPIVLTGLGTVTALNTATIQSQITGLLVSVDFQEGQTVKKGDRLAQIDPRTYQATLDQAEATLTHDQAHLRNGEINLQRYKDLVKEDSVSVQMRDDQQATVDQLNAQLKIDEAAIENAKAELSYTSLFAPFDGVTGIRLLDVGNIIHPPTSLSTTTQMGGPDPNALVVVTEVQPISVIFTLPTGDVAEIQRAMAAGPLETVAFSQDGKTKLDVGKLLLVDNQADPTSGTVRLKAVFPNAQRQLWPGAFVNVRLVTSTQHNGLTIPLDAVQQGPQGQIVFVIGQDHKVSLRPVSMRESLDGEALIDKGLSAGETVVVRGQYRLQSGSLVSPVDPKNADSVPNPTTASSGMLP